MNYRIVSNILGKVLLAEAILLLLPMVAALVYRESPMPFLWTILPLVALGLGLNSVKPKSGDLFAREGFVTVGEGTQDVGPEDNPLVPFVVMECLL